MITGFGVDELSRRLVPDELWALWMNWAVGDRSTGPAPLTALLANTPRSPAISAVVAIAPDLKRDAGVLGVLLGGAVWMGAATAPAAQATTGTRLSVAFTRQIAGYGHDHRVWCVMNCVTITTYHDGLRWILRDV
jgi:hypothetical protein